MAVDATGDVLLGEILEVADGGGNVDEYCALRAAGVAHGDATGVLRLGLSVEGYLAGLRSVLGYDQMVWANSLGIALCTLARGSRAGLAFKEMTGWSAVESGLEWYVGMRYSGSTRGELDEVVGKHPEALGGYSELREGGTSHREALAVLSCGVEANRYLAKRECGMNHRRALRAERVSSRREHQASLQLAKSERLAARRAARAVAKAADMGWK